MRTSNSMKNSTTSMICYIISIVVGFISQYIFIKILGAEYLGLNGLFSNILTMLSLFELGIGSAIIYNLYKTIAEGQKEQVKSLMKFYKKAYNIIAILIMVFKFIFKGDINIGCPEDVAKSIPYKNKTYVTNAIDFSRLNDYENIKLADDDKFIILMFGYTYERKGVDLAIKAISK